MTEKEIEKIMEENEVRHSIVSIYNMRKFLYHNHVKWPMKISGISNTKEYYNKYTEEAFEMFSKEQPEVFVVGSETSYERHKQEYLNNFDEADRECMQKYWNDTIGYSCEILKEKLQMIIHKYTEVRCELDRVMYSNCAIPVYEYAENFGKKIVENKKQIGIDDCGLDLIMDVSKYKWASSLPGSVKYVKRGDKQYCVVLSDRPKLGNYLDLALNNEENYHFIGDYNAYLNPFTYEQIVNKDIDYNINLQRNFNVKNKLDMLKWEVFAEYIDQNFHEVPFAKFVHLANGLEQMIEGYRQVEKIFFQDLKNLNSKKMIKKQKQFLKLSGEDATRFAKEKSQEYQQYFDNIIFDIFDKFYENAKNYFSLTETPFPEFD